MLNLLLQILSIICWKKCLSRNENIMVKNSFVVGSYQMPSEHITIWTIVTIVRCFIFYSPPRPGNIHWYFGVEEGRGRWLIIFRGSSIISLIYIELNTGRCRDGWGNIAPVYRFLPVTARKTKFVNLSSLVSIVERSLNGWLLNLDFKSSDCIRPTESWTNKWRED